MSTIDFAQTTQTPADEAEAWIEGWLFVDAAAFGNIAEPSPEDAEPEETAPACLHTSTRIETFYPDETPSGALVQVRVCDECDEEVSFA